MARKVGASREQVVDAAVAIADRDGVAAVTLTTVAAAVGLRPPSLYAHVDGLDGLRREMRRRAYELLAQSVRAAVGKHDGVPLEGLRAIGHACRAFAVSQPGLYRCLAPGPVTDPDADELEPVRLTASVLEQLGIPDSKRVHLVRTFMALLRGFLDLELADAFGANSVDESFESMLDLFIQGIDPLPGDG